MVLTEAINTSPSTRLNLMLIDSDDLSIQRWANKYQIPQQLINNGQITINHGDQNYQALKINKKNTPLLLLAKNGSSSVVDLGRF